MICVSLQVQKLSFPWRCFCISDVNLAPDLNKEGNTIRNKPGVFSSIPRAKHNRRPEFLLHTAPGPDNTSILDSLHRHARLLPIHPCAKFFFIQALLVLGPNINTAGPVASK